MIRFFIIGVFIGGVSGYTIAALMNMADNEDDNENVNVNENDNENV